jgi:hypothetical protein
VSWHGFLIFLHVLLLAYWLGTDLGVFYSSRYILRRDLPVETRATIARILLALDLSPRICLVLTLPVGLSLAADLGLSPIRDGWLVAVWIAALAWLALVVTIYRAEESPMSAVLRRLDLWLRLGLVAVLVVAVTVSLAGGRPFGASWLALKVGAYAVAVASGVGIRLVLRPFGPALRRLVTGGSSPETEAALARSLRGTYPLVLTIWAMLLLAALLGAVKP